MAIPPERLVVHPAVVPGKEQGGFCKGGCQSDGSFYQQTSLTISFKTALALAVTGHLCGGDKPWDSAAPYSLTWCRWDSSANPKDYSLCFSIHLPIYFPVSCSDQ